MPHFPPLAPFDHSQHVTAEQIHRYYGMFCLSTHAYPLNEAFQSIFELISSGYERKISVMDVEHHETSSVYEKRMAAMDAEHHETSSVYEKRMAAMDAEYHEISSSYERRIAAMDAEHHEIISGYERKIAGTKVKHQQQSQELEKQCALLQQERDYIDRTVKELQAEKLESNRAITSYLLQAPPLASPTPKGSTSRAMSWRNAKKAHNYDRQILPVNRFARENIRRTTAPLIDAVNVHGKEQDLYEPFLLAVKKSMESIFGPTIASFHNTSRKPYLDGLQPDLTIALPDMTTPDPGSVMFLFEMKKTKTSPIDSDKELGQVWDYLVVLMAAQAGRRFFTAVLSDLVQNIVISVEVIENRYSIIQYNNNDIYSIFAYLLDSAFSTPAHCPPKLGFSSGLPNMLQRLGNPKHCTIGLFPTGKRSELMAVKYNPGPYASVEISMLREFANNPTRPASIPLLVHEFNNIEFGITPIGRILHPAEFANDQQPRSVLLNVHEALVWLHKQNIVHRDVRCENIIVTPSGQGVLIDFDCACRIDRPSMTSYRGGYICCPPEHIRVINYPSSGWNEPYLPAFSHDWLAFVLLINCIVFPNNLVNFNSRKVLEKGSMEAARILRLWKQLEQSVIWGPFVAAAKVSDAVKLLKLMDLFIWV